MRGNISKAKDEFKENTRTKIPASEAWFFRNRQAMKNVSAGLKDASEGKISKLNLKDLQRAIVQYRQRMKRKIGVRP